MISNRVEWLAGRRWASDIVMSSAKLLQLDGGLEKLLKTLRHGLNEKPADYARGVQEIIDIVEGAA